MSLTGRTLTPGPYPEARDFGQEASGRVVPGPGSGSGSALLVPADISTVAISPAPVKTAVGVPR